MPRLKKKERRRLKRKEKRKQAIRLRNQSPYGLLRSAGSVEACLINDDWRQSGLAVIYVLCRAPGRPPAMGNFLIDLWCAGLKDAWGRLDFTHEDFRELVDNASWKTGLEFVDCGLDLARKLLAGSVRFAHDNGFRLPPRYESWLAVLGGVGDWSTADLGDFGVDGKLRWVGPMADLRRRLAGCSVEEFLARDDVDFIAGLDEPIPYDESADELDADLQLLHGNILDAIRRWCFANGEAPHPRLPEAVDTMLESILQSGDAGPGEPEETEILAVRGNLYRMLAMEPPEEGQQICDALDQVQRFTCSFESGEEMHRAIGLDDSVDEEYE
ncbi:MAG: hypothetical protein WBF17_26950 [Phycisphaerae bacterium]